jgi:hypothetical protein
MRQNAGFVYHFVDAAIKSCRTTEHIESCRKLVDNASQYLFVPALAEKLLIKECELLIQPYPVYE